MRQIREYNIQEKIGEGGMGVVYKAYDLNLERYVAIKAIHAALTSNEELINRFKQEARLQSRLVHPNIVSLYNLFSENNIYYMVMEYVDGETLSQRIKRVGLLPPHQCIPMFIKILKAVEFAHNNGVVHRDIKPSNILITKTNEIKVMDFGIAKLVGEKGMTKTGTKMGTISYMSPEQILGEKDIDGRSDIFSLGITFFEMLTGQLPYNTETESDFILMKQIVDNKLPSVKKYYPYVPDRVDFAISKATKKNKYERFQSCKDFVDYIKEEEIRERENSSVKQINITNSYEQQSSHITTSTGSVYDFNKVNDGSQKFNINEFTPDVDNQYYGIKGWLLFFCIISVIIRPIFSYNTIISEIQSIPFLEVYYSSYVPLVILEIIIIIVLSIYRFIIGILLWTKHQKAVYYVKKNLIIELVVIIILNIILLAGVPDEAQRYIVPGLIGNTFGSVLLFVIWYNYFNKSKRVKSTFQNNNLNN